MDLFGTAGIRGPVTEITPELALSVGRAVAGHVTDAGSETVVVARVRDRNEEELAYLSEAGIVPGQSLELVEKAPIGMVTVVHEGGEQSLPERVAETIRARPTAGAADEGSDDDGGDDTDPAEVVGSG
jgi:Fe2+ transport system protein FeoA